MAVNVEYIIRLRDKFSASVQKANAQADKLNGKVNKINSSFAGLGSTIARIGGIVAVGAVAKQVATLGIEMEKTRISFTTFLGGTEEAARGADVLINQLNEFANVTPFTNDQVIKASRTLLAFGFQANELQPTLKMLGDISAGTGKDLSELGVIFGQIKGAGKLMGQDLLQLINAGFNPLQVMAQKAAGTTGDVQAEMARLKDEMSKGAISFDMVTQAFKDATSEGGLFNDMMEKQSKTVGGRISTLIGKLQLLGIQIGEALLPAIGYVTDLAIALVENTEVLETMGIVIGIAAGAFGIFKAAMFLATAQTTLLTAAQWLLNVALNANPIGVVVGLLAAFAAAIAVAWRHSETFRGVILGLWEVFKNVFLNIKMLALNVLGNLGNLLLGVFTLDKDKIMQSLSGLKGAFVNFGEQTAKDFRRGFAKGATVEADVEQGSLTGDAGILDRLSKNGKGTGGSTAGDGVDAGISGIKSAAPKTFNINIEKLVEDLNVNTTNLTESATRIKEEVQKALLTAITDVSIVSE